MRLERVATSLSPRRVSVVEMVVKLRIFTMVKWCAQCFLKADEFQGCVRSGQACAPAVVGV